MRRITQFFFTLLLIVASVNVVQAKDVSFAVANGTPKTNNGSFTWNVDDITIAGTNVKVSNNNNVYSLQQNSTSKVSTFAITSTSSNIVKVQVTFTGNNRTGSATVTEGTSTTASESYSVSGNTGTWSGAAQSKVTFSFSAGAGFRISSFVVTTSDGTTTVTPVAPTFDSKAGSTTAIAKTSGDKVALAATAGDVYYQWSTSTISTSGLTPSDITKSGSKWTKGTSATVPDVTAQTTEYLYAVSVGTSAVASASQAYTVSPKNTTVTKPGKPTVEWNGTTGTSFTTSSSDFSSTTITLTASDADGIVSGWSDGSTAKAISRCTEAGNFENGTATISGGTFGSGKTKRYLTVYAYKNNGTDKVYSDASVITWTLEAPATVDAPTYDPVSGSSVNAGSQVTIKSGTGTTLYYKTATTAQNIKSVALSDLTASGSTWTKASSTTATVTAPESGDLYVYSVAVNGSTVSNVAEGHYTVSSAASNTKEVSITSFTGTIGSDGTYTQDGITIRTKTNGDKNEKGEINNGKLLVKGGFSFSVKGDYAIKSIDFTFDDNKSETKNNGLDNTDYLKASAGIFDNAVKGTTTDAITSISWLDGGAKNIPNVGFNYTDGNHSLYITGVKITYYTDAAITTTPITITATAAPSSVTTGGKSTITVTATKSDGTAVTDATYKYSVLSSTTSTGSTISGNVVTAGTTEGNVVVGVELDAASLQKYSADPFTLTIPVTAAATATLTPVSNHTWDYSTITSVPDGVQDGGLIEYNGMAIASKMLKFAEDADYVHLKVAGGSKITVSAQSGGSGERSLYISGSNSTSSPLATITISTKSGKASNSWTNKGTTAQDVYILRQSSKSMYVSKIVVEPATAQDAVDIKLNATATSPVVVEHTSTITTAPALASDATTAVSGLALTYTIKSDGTKGTKGASVDKNGVVTVGDKAGNVVVTVSWVGDDSYNAASEDVTITARAATDADLSALTLTATADPSSVTEGSTSQVNVDAKVTGSSKSLSGLTYTYASSKTDVATVDVTGKVTAKKAGTTTITVTHAADNFYKAATATVDVIVTKAASGSAGSVDLNTFSSSSAQNVTTFKFTATPTDMGDGITITSTGSSNRSAASSSNVKFAQKGGNLVISSANRPISSITFTYSQTPSNVKVTASTGSFTNPTWTAANNSTKEVTLTNSGSNLYIKTIHIEFASANSVAAPTITPADGTYTLDQANSTNVVMTPASGTTMYVAFGNNTSVDNSGNGFTTAQSHTILNLLATQKQNVENNVLTIQAIDYNGDKNSDVTTRKYTIDVDEPVITTPDNRFNFLNSITATLTLPKSYSIGGQNYVPTAYYTTDGSDPRTSSTRKAVDNNTATFNETTTVKMAVNYVALNVWSDVVTTTFTKVAASTPVMSYTPQSDEVSADALDDWSQPALSVTNSDNVAITDAQISYTSSNEAVATVDANGKITLTGDAGTATITAKVTGPAYYNTASATYTVKVNAGTVIEKPDAIKWDFSSMDDSKDEDNIRADKNWKEVSQNSAQFYYNGLTVATTANSQTLKALDGLTIKSPTNNNDFSIFLNDNKYAYAKPGVSITFQAQAGQAVIVKYKADQKSKTPKWDVTNGDVAQFTGTKSNTTWSESTFRAKTTGDVTITVNTNVALNIQYIKLGDIKETVPAPSITTDAADADNITAADAGKTFTVTPPDVTESATVKYIFKYTVDGTDPKTSATSYTFTAATSMNLIDSLKRLNADGLLDGNTMTVKAVTIKNTVDVDGNVTASEASDVTSEGFTYVVAPPTLTPSQTFSTTLDVTLTAAASGTTYYSEDGTIPTEKSSSITTGTKTWNLTDSKTIIAFALDANGFRSASVTGTYTKGIGTSTIYELAAGVDAYSNYNKKNAKNAYHAKTSSDNTKGYNNTNPIVEFYYGDARTDGWKAMTSADGGAVIMPKDAVIPTNGNVPQIGGYFEMVPSATGRITFTAYAETGNSPNVWVVERDASGNANRVTVTGLDRNYNRSYALDGGKLTSFSFPVTMGNQYYVYGTNGFVGFNKMEFIKTEESTTKMMPQLSFTYPTFEITTGKKATNAARLTYRGQEITKPTGAIHYKSLDTNIATVDELSGTVTAVSSDTATVQIQAYYVPGPDDVYRSTELTPVTYILHITKSVAAPVFWPSEDGGTYPYSLLLVNATSATPGAKVIFAYLEGTKTEADLSAALNESKTKDIYFGKTKSNEFGKVIDKTTTFSAYALAPDGTQSETVTVTFTLDGTNQTLAAPTLDPASVGTDVPIVYTNTQVRATGNTGYRIFGKTGNSPYKTAQALLDGGNVNVGTTVVDIVNSSQNYHAGDTKFNARYSQAVQVSPDGQVSSLVIENKRFTQPIAKSDFTLTYTPATQTIDLDKDAGAASFVQPILSHNAAITDEQIAAAKTAGTLKFSIVRSGNQDGSDTKFTTDGDDQITLDNKSGRVTVTATFVGDEYFYPATATYVVNLVGSDAAEMPTIDPPTRDYRDAFNATVTAPEHYPVYYYVGDGTDVVIPNKDNPDGQGGFNLAAGQTTTVAIPTTDGEGNELAKGTETTVHAVAYDPTWQKSNSATSETYTYVGYEYVEPVEADPYPTPYSDNASYTFREASLKVLLTTTTPKAVIFYNLDGSTTVNTDPDNGLQYNAATGLNLTESHTINAIAVLFASDGRTVIGKSPVRTFKYIQKLINVLAPDIDPAGGEVDALSKATISCQTPGAVIYYTTDGSTPAANNGFRIDPESADGTASTDITIYTDVTVKAVAILEGNLSDVTTAVFTIKAGGLKVWVANDVTTNKGVLYDKVVDPNVNNHNQKYAPDNIRAVFGAGHWNSDKYKEWSEVKSGEDNIGVPLDGVGKYNINSDGDALTEVDSIYDHSNAIIGLPKTNDVYKHTFQIPAHGTYVMFEPTADGDLTIWAMQNGAVYTSSKQNKFDPTFVRRRPVYMVDEMGHSLVPKDAVASGKLSSYWDNIDPDKLAGRGETGQTGDKQNLFTKEGAKSIYYAFNNHVTDKKMSTSTMFGRNFLVLNDGNHEDVAKVLESGQKSYTAVTDNTGYCLPSSSYVRYTFHLRAGKTYFFFGLRTKIGIRGFTFETEEHQSAEQSNELATDKTLDENATSVDWTNATYNANGEPTTNTTNFKLDRVNGSASGATVAFKGQTWASLVLPFSVSEKQVEDIFGEGTKILHFQGITNHTETLADGTTKDWTDINFDNHYYNMIVAGTPVFIRPGSEADITSVTFKNVQPETTGVDKIQSSLGLAESHSQYELLTGYYMTGSYTPSVLNQYDLFISNDGKIMQWLSDKGDGKIKGTRGWISYDEGTTAAPAKQLRNLRLKIDGEGASGISTDGLIKIFEPEQGVEENAKYDGRVYNLQGQEVASDASKLNSLPQGVYIVNGKKYVVK